MSMYRAFGAKIHRLYSFFNCLLNARLRRRGEMQIPTMIHASNQHMSAKLVLFPAPLTFFSGCYGLKSCQNLIFAKTK